MGIRRHRCDERSQVAVPMAIQVLCPMNRGAAGARGIDHAQRAALNPPGELSVEILGTAVSAGAEAMQIERRRAKLKDRLPSTAPGGKA